MADLLIATSSLSIDPIGAGAAVEYQVNNLSFDHNTEAKLASPMDLTSKVAFSGMENWSGTFSVLYDDTSGSPSPNSALFAPQTGELTFAITDQTHTTPIVVTLSGDIVITGTSTPFDMGPEVTSMEVTFLGNGILDEAQV